MPYQLFWVDAFTQRFGAGNPAAVVPLDSWPEDALLQRLAFENGLSETAFFVKTGQGRYHLRWFTPAVEVDLCGHATLASAHVLFSELGEGSATLSFDTKSGPLSVTRDEAGRLELNFPAQPADQQEPDDYPLARALAQALGEKPVLTFRNRTRWLCVYSKAAQVRALRPDQALLSRLTPGRMIVTAPGEDACDFVSRFFAPDAGIPEDPVTGSAHCTLVPYWAGRLGRKQLRARQVSARGGELWCRLDGNRVRIAGHATLYLKGTLLA